MSRVLKIVAAAVVVVLLAGAGAYWFIFREDAPAKVDTSCGPGRTVPKVADFSGPWKVKASTATGDGLLQDKAPGSWVGYRMEEDLQGVHATAVGRTGQIQGTVQADTAAVKQATFEVDMTALHSSRSQRDNRMRSESLETDRFPKAKFSLTAPIALKPGTACQKVTAAGTLELHGQAKPVAVPLTVSASGGAFEVRGSLDLALADYGIAKPKLPASFVTIGDRGRLELDLLLSR